MRRTKSTKRKGFDIPGMKSMKCPCCGSAVHLRSADGIYRENSGNTQLYVCSKYPECDAYVRVHPGTATPMGSLANPQLRALRTKTHRQFDRLHESGLMTRKDAYGWLAHMLQSPLSQAHIGYLSEYYCNLIIEESGKVLERYKWKLAAGRPLEPAMGGEYRAAQ